MWLVGWILTTLGSFNFFALSWQRFIAFKQQFITGVGHAFTAQGGILAGTPALKPAFIGVGYIIGPKLASLNFSGGLLAWGLLTPVIYYFLFPYIDMDQWAQYLYITKQASDLGLAYQTISEPEYQIFAVWKTIVRPVAIGGMLAGTIFTLFKMRKSLGSGIGRSVKDLKKATRGGTSSERINKDLRFTWVMMGITGAGISTFLITFLIFKTSLPVALVSTAVMIIAGFLFSAVSGYLVGIIGSSNNPVSGLTVSTVLVTALLMFSMGVAGEEGIPAVLAVAAIICVSVAVAGEMLQDLKVGHLLGGTPWRMQAGNIVGVVVSAAVMFIPIMILHESDIIRGALEGYPGGLGSKELPAPQATLIAILTSGILKGEMAWPLIIMGMLLGTALILMQVKSPMLIAIGMYLPLETTFTIFVGGLIKGVVQMIENYRGHDDLQKARTENAGVLIASGLIAGEALIGLLFAALVFFGVDLYKFDHPLYVTALVIMGLIAWVLIRIPIRSAGKPEVPSESTVNQS